MFKFDEEKQKEGFEKLRQKEEEELAQILSVKYGVKYIDLKLVSINNDALRIIPEKKSREIKIAAFDRVGKKIKVAVIAPQQTEIIEYLQELEKQGYKISVYMVSHQSMGKMWDRYKEMSYTTKTTAGSVDMSAENIKKFFSEINNLEDVHKVFNDVLNTKTNRNVSNFFEAILASALSVNASDVHIEPEEKNITLRFRLDGILTVVTKFDPKIYHLLLSRIKLISGLKLNVIKKPQDGRFSIKLEDRDIEIRVSVLPDAYGESIVLRILNPETISVSVDNLGIEKYLLEILMKEIKRPNGMILNTGPTGSGKTTTLYAFLKTIHTPEIKIITIENPIEYHLPGVVQTQVDPKKGYTFLEGLRSSLRQDPDVIMVGEIRDNETAKIAVNSALTGHLVFSTLHTNNAVGAFYRLIDLEIKPNIISTAINIVIAQRLIRKLCEYCKQEIVAEGEDKKTIARILNEIENAGKYTNNTEKIFNIVGCAKCNHTGYRGRIGIFEAILVDAETSKLLEQNPSKEITKQIFKKQNILTLAQDGIIKVLKGLTTLSEIRRVVDLEEDL
ncbi:MAG: type II/IV secretion system protein [Patescibacteria group bacterium]